MGVIEGGDQGEGEDEWRREGGGKARQSMVGLVGCAERALMVVGGAAVMMNVQWMGVPTSGNHPRSVNRSQN